MCFVNFVKFDFYTKIRLHMRTFRYILCALSVALTAACTEVGIDTCYSDPESPIIANSISNQRISSFAEDEHGHIWIGTFRGLNRFNVHEFHQYFCTDEENTLPDNQIQCLLADSRNRLWISTVNGMALYTDKDDFKPVQMESMSRNSVQILEDNSGRIFINTSISLCLYDEEQEEFVEVKRLVDSGLPPVSSCFIAPDDDIILAGSMSIMRLDSETFEVKDSVALADFPSYFSMTPDGRLWMSSYSTLRVYDLNTSSFVELPSVFAKHKLFSQSAVTHVHQYGASMLIFNTEQDGLFLYDKAENTLRHHSESGFPFNVPDVKVNCMYNDSKGNLWIGSYDQGYHVVYSYEERFNNDGWLKVSLGQKSVVSVDCDSKDNLWISTLNDGLYMYNSKSHIFKQIDLARLFAYQPADKWDISSVFVDKDDYVWLAGGLGTVRCRCAGNELVVDQTWPLLMPMSLSQDSDGSIWIGSLGENVYYISPEDDQLHSQKLISSYFTFTPCVLPLADGKLLAASFQHGLSEIDAAESHVRQITIEESVWKDCIRRSVFVPSCMYQDEDGIVWIGTVANGLMKYEPATQSLTHISGAPCLDISSIEEDRQGNIWVSTQYGLGKYDRSSERFINWFESDGIGGNQFYDRASCRMSDGTLVFGGTHGLTMFNPIDVTSHHDVSVYFEDLKVHNRLMRPGKDECLDKALPYGPEIRLEYDQNSFSISFAAIEYGEYERVKYMYMLDGFDNYWIEAHNNREAYYSNIPAGKYDFKVCVTSMDESAVLASNSIRVVILRPWWFSWWAFAIYILCFAALLWLIARVRSQIMIEKSAKLKAQQEKEYEKKINRMNMSFFANISHEFRTPLTMISGPVTQLQESSEMTLENKRLLNIVQRNIRRMLRLVNQLLDFNKMEEDTLKLQVKSIDVIEQFRNLADIFKVTADEKNVMFRTYGLEDSLVMWADDDKLDKICFNLLSNAMKFTQAGGKVEFSLDVISREEAAHIFTLSDKDIDTRYVKVVVKDSGPGIPEDQLEKVFERYYQLENQMRGAYNWGSGIGLYFARTLAQMHHGYLKAGNRTTGPGAVFTLILPLSDISYSDAEKCHDTEQNTPFKVSSVIYTEHPQTSDVEDRRKVLIVDDDMDVIHYLKELLAPRYEVMSRFDADSAYVLMKEEAPDVVISDVVMPGKTGYELCRQIKDNMQLSHIPVILLTAKATVDDQVHGLDCGADAYVTKPFEPQYILALISSQIKNREKVRTLLSEVTDVENLEEDTLSPQDNAFMTELYQLMENELSNSELDVSRMTELLHISRTKFYYKVKGLTGENPSVFFKRYKLNRAAQLLKERNYNISEIADMTGFSTLAHFSTSFKKQFGMSPSEYMK